MDSFLHGYWWLIFPLMFFAYAAWDSWLSYKRSKERLDLLRTYASQGKDPPPELLRALHDEDDLDEEDPGYGSYRRFGRYGRYGRRRYLRRHGPYWAWRTAIVTGAVAAGFWIAAEYTDMPGADGAFGFVAIILACVSAGHVALALLAIAFRGR